MTLDAPQPATRRNHGFKNLVSPGRVRLRTNKVELPPTPTPTTNPTQTYMTTTSSVGHSTQPSPSHMTLNPCNSTDYKRACLPCFHPLSSQARETYKNCGSPNLAVL
eukprot:TRINITY_DN13932_c0_g2_i1.p1 TRINITY_DN13932_c0_g2~~TRINITY_DN13932_c0_g2_i1.p1  ORF type:complete len:107 (+),score=8.08 TRINITY_DN13932_c0_g2_i1:1034-1354(+)